MCPGAVCGEEWPHSRCAQCEGRAASTAIASVKIEGFTTTGNKEGQASGLCALRGTGVKLSNCRKVTFSDLQTEV